MLTVAEVAARLRVSRMTVYRLVERGQIGHVKVGQSVRIREADYAAFIAVNEHRVVPGVSRLTFHASS